MTDQKKKLGTCDAINHGNRRMIARGVPHERYMLCVNWREQPAQQEPPPLTNPVVRKAYESGVDTGFKVGQMNPDQIKWWFDEREAAVIDEIATKQELSRQAVLRQALRVYQLIVVGSHELRELNPMPKSAGSVEGMSAEREQEVRQFEENKFAAMTNANKRLKAELATCTKSEDCE